MAFTRSGGNPFAAPTFTLGTSNVEGSTRAVVESDATLAMFATNAPLAVNALTGVAVGTVALAARRDHAHQVDGTGEWFAFLRLFNH